MKDQMKFTGRFLASIILSEDHVEMQLTNTFIQQVMHSTGYAVKSPISALFPKNLQNAHSVKPCRAKRFVLKIESFRYIF